MEVACFRIAPLARLMLAVKRRPSGSCKSLYSYLSYLNVFTLGGHHISTRLVDVWGKKSNYIF